MATLLGNLLTSFTNGLLGENFSAGTNLTAKAVGSATKKVLESVPGVAGAFAKASADGALKGGVAARVGANPLSGITGAFDYAVSTGKDLISDPVRFVQDNPSPSPSPAPAPVTVPSDGGTSVTMPDYLYADLAKAYGMDASTAYQEALSNTSYQRAVKDLEAAGINPLMAVGGYANGASGVYSAHLAGSGSGASPVSTGVSSAKSAHTFYNLLSNAGTAIGALVGGRTGSIAGKAIGTILGNALDG